MVLASDVRDVVYLTWIVPVAAVREFVPQGIRIIERDGLTLFTVLTYRHGHFGPAFLGPLRRWFPSPLQGNWRLYVESIEGIGNTGRVVLFVRNVFDSLLYVLGSRLGSDALPSHLPARFIHECSGEGYRTQLESGRGSAPDLSSSTVRSRVRALPEGFERFFGAWEEAVSFLCHQEAAVVAVEDEGRVAHARISLPIDIATAESLESVATSCRGFLEQVGATGKPFCFAVPRIRFSVLSERLLPPGAQVTFL